MESSTVKISTNPASSATVDEIAREAADNIGDELSRTSGDKYVLHGILYRHITAAIAPLQAKLDRTKAESSRILDEYAHGAAQRCRAFDAKLKCLQAELEQARNQSVRDLMSAAELNTRQAKELEQANAEKHDLLDDLENVEVESDETWIDALAGLGLKPIMYDLGETREETINCIVGLYGQQIEDLQSRLATAEATHKKAQNGIIRWLIAFAPHVDKSWVEDMMEAGNIAQDGCLMFVPIDAA